MLIGPRDGLVHSDWSHHSIYWGVNKHCTCRISFSKDVWKNTCRENLQQRSKTQNSFNTVTLCQMFHNLNFDILQCFFFFYYYYFFNLGSVGCVLPYFSSCFSHFNPATKFSVWICGRLCQSVMWKLVKQMAFLFLFSSQLQTHHHHSEISHFFCVCALHLAKSD